MPNRPGQTRLSTAKPWPADEFALTRAKPAEPILEVRFETAGQPMGQPTAPADRASRPRQPIAPRSGRSARPTAPIVPEGLDSADIAKAGAADRRPARTGGCRTPRRGPDSADIAKAGPPIVGPRGQAAAALPAADLIRRT